MIVIGTISYEVGFIIGIITIIGLILKRESPTHILESFIKVMIGFSILIIGSELATKELSEIAVLIEDVFSRSGIIPNNELIATMAQWFYGKKLVLIMVIGMLLHLFIARFTKYKHIFLTGHHILFMAALITGVLAGTNWNNYLQIIIGSILLAILMSFLPRLAQPLMNELFPNEQIGLAHFGNIGFYISGKIAKIFKKRHKEFKEDFFGKNFRLISDPHVLILVFMFSFVLFLFSFSGHELYVDSMYEGMYRALKYSFQSSLYFTSGIYIIIMGVRMMLHELLHSFQEIANKLIPNAIPSLDVPVVFPFAPHAVVLGFFSSMIGGVVGMVILISLKMTIVLPAIVAHFFSGGTSGVFGYKIGGYKGAIVSSFVHGLLISFLPLLLIPVMHELGYTHTTFSETDFGVFGFLLYKILQLFQ